uniref:Uncharacterized protein n=1 Tax=Rhizochromulina marina TaxID=1034831 RepID=A0A7S2S2C2_9STRA|mmetsp:Transcript_24096/g.70669  ORF Transcript_24096/g.70669 Transcript_24096/m.70669 type:complete len:278 (+) Transcript_24096:1-834(+)
MRHAFEQKSVDLYVMSAVVAAFQILWGFCFLPVLAMPAFGGVPFHEMPTQLWFGFRCFMGMNSLPGDHCDGVWYSNATMAMLIYCAINFGYNLLSLLVTKHGSALLLVVSSALALPVTNLAFSWHALMGDDAEEFLPNDIVALVVVVLGFVVYSLPSSVAETDSGSSRSLRKPAQLFLQAAGGSMVYTRPRSNSDPQTPRFNIPRSNSRYGKYSPSARLLRHGSSPHSYLSEDSPLLTASPGVAFQSIATDIPASSRPELPQVEVRSHDQEGLASSL